MKIKLLCTSFILSLGVLASSASASVLTEKTLSLDLSQQLANKAVQICKAKGYNVSVTVVDKAGVVRTQLRADGAGTHTLESSRKKAFTAASMGSPTANVAEAIAKNPSLEGLRNMDANIIFLAGGLPIKIDNTVIAGIGIGGAPNGNIDAECAAEAIESLSAQLK